MLQFTVSLAQREIDQYLDSGRSARAKVGPVTSRTGWGERS